MHDELIQLLSPSLKAMGYELWGCEFLTSARPALLRIYIDKPGGIGIEDCQEASRAISALLDVEDPIEQHYALEVSSPGIPRPLFYLWQYQSYVGRPVQIKTFKSIAGSRKFSGTLVSVTAQALILEMNGEEQELLFSNVSKGHLIDERGEQ